MEKPGINRQGILGRLSRMAMTVLLLAAGCSDPAKNLDAKPEGARLTPRDVIRIAKREAEQQGIDLRKYEEPDTHYQSARAKTWSVYFGGKTTAGGKHFDVYVDDQTGE